jgi:hypothetical protein
MTTHLYDPLDPSYFDDVDARTERDRTLGMAETDLVAGDCHLANTAIREATTKVPIHPIQVLARAYGLEGD